MSVIENLTMKGLSTEEQETVIVIPRKGIVRITTSDPTMFTKIKRVFRDEDSEWTLVGTSHLPDTPEDQIVEVSVETSNRRLVSLRAKSLSKNKSDDGSDEPNADRDDCTVEEDSEEAD